MDSASRRKKNYEESHLNILSLGAGVQSSTMALMATSGELGYTVDHAIFADTQAEPREVYDFLAYLTPLLTFPVHVVTHGNLETDFLAALDDRNVRCGQPPFMVWNKEKNKEARLWRQCTSEYKLAPIRRKVNELRDKAKVKQLIGISLDEAHRMKPSGVRHIENVYPLVELGMTRQHCLNWMQKNGYKTPPKSACYFCPYMDDSRLRDMRDRRPADWQRLIWFDEEIRKRQRETVHGAGITGTLYVHRSCKPITEVDLRTAEDAGQLNLFGEECEWMCGV